MSSWALIKNGVVVNTVLFGPEWDADSITEWGNGSFDAAVNIDGLNCSVGWTYNGSVFTDPNAAPAATNQELYQAELKSLASVYSSDITNLSDQYAKAALIDGVNEDTKKAAIYAEYQARKVTYQNALSALKVKYGV